MANLIEMRNIVKVFPPNVVALDDVGIDEGSCEPRRDAVLVECGFAGAVRPNVADHLAVGNVKTDLFQRVDVFIGGGEKAAYGLCHAGLTAAHTECFTEPGNMDQECLLRSLYGGLTNL